MFGNSTQTLSRAEPVGRFLGKANRVVELGPILRYGNQPLKSSAIHGVWSIMVTNSGDIWHTDLQMCITTTTRRFDGFTTISSTANMAL